MIRVRIPAYSPLYQQGDQTGELVKTTRQKATGLGRMLTSNASGMLDIAHVRLDKSGKTISFLLDDCELLLPPPPPTAEPG